MIGFDFVPGFVRHVKMHVCMFFKTDDEYYEHMKQKEFIDVIIPTTACQENLKKKKDAKV